MQVQVPSYISSSQNSRTLLGDCVGSITGAIFGGCPNATYGESVGCVAITRNASVLTITTTAVLSMLISFVSPFVAFIMGIIVNIILSKAKEEEA